VVSGPVSLRRTGRRPNAPLGPTQRRVLLGLGTRGASAANDWAAWYPLRYGEVYGAIQRLGMRGLVDVDGWKDGARTYRLTKAGVEAVDRIAPSNDDVLDEDSEPDIDDEPPPDVGPPGSGAIITEYTGFEPGLEED
jgi:hypothetical protein